MVALRRRRRRALLLTAGALAPFVLIFFLLLSVRTFEIVLLPAEAGASTDLSASEGIAFIVGERLFLFSQEARLDAVAPGYHAFQTTVAKHAERQSIQIQLTPLPGEVVITVEADEDVEISLDGEVAAIARTLETELEAGPHQLEIRAPGIRPNDVTIEVAGFGKREEFRFETIRVRAWLTLEARPKDAEIRLDGNLLALPVRDLPIAPGGHEITIARDNHEPVQRRFEAEADQIIDLGLIRLKPLPVQLTIRTRPTTAAVLIGGEFRGETNNTFTLAPNVRHQIRLTRPRTEDVRFVFEAPPGARLTRAFDLAALRVTAEILARPEAQMLVNGSAVGTTPQTLELADGTEIRVQRNGYVDQSAILSALDGARQTFQFELLTPRAEAIRQAPERIEALPGLALRKFPPVTFPVQLTSADWHQSARTERTIEVRITRPFYLGEKEVTLAHFRQFEQGHQSGAPEQTPASQISWNQAARFCNWLSARSGLLPVYAFDQQGQLASVNQEALGYRLPTEFEWQTGVSYDVARGRVVAPFPWGKGARPPRAYGNFAGQEAAASIGTRIVEHLDRHASVAPVGAHAPNFNGLYDLAGNLSEWVHDYYGPLPKEAVLTDYLGAENGVDHVIKGGNFKTGRVEALRAAARGFQVAGSETTGFRTARWIH